jgi:hypothetical protein
MPNYSMDNDPNYWQYPDRFKEMAEFAPEIGARAAYYPLGDAYDESAPVALVLGMEPGYVVTRHSHPCERFEVVVRGSIETEGKTMIPGDVMTAHAWEFYGPKVAGPNGCTTIEVFATMEGAYTRVVEGDDGQPVVANLLKTLRQALQGSGVPQPVN